MKTSQFRESSGHKRSESPTTLRLSMLADRWNHVNKYSDRDKNDKRELIESYIVKLDNLLNFDKQRDDDKFKNIKEGLFKLVDNINQESGFTQETLARYQDQIINSETNIQNIFDDEKNIKKKVEIQLLRQIEERFEKLNLQFNKNNQIHADKYDKQLHQVHGSLDQIKATILDEIKTRELSQSNLVQQIDQSINQFQDTLLIEKEVRIQTENKIYSMIDDVHKSIQQEIQTEKNQRLDSEERLLRLLQDTCIKLDENFNS